MGIYVRGALRSLCCAVLLVSGGTGNGLSGSTVRPEEMSVKEETGGMNRLSGRGILETVVPEQSASGLLSSVLQAVKAGREIGFRFEATDRNGRPAYASEGVVKIRGDRYRMEVPDELLAVCNGTTRWIYKQQEDEIVIAGAAGSSRDLLENPFAVLEPAAGEYDMAVITAGNAASGAGNSYLTRVVLTPRKARYSYKKITVSLQKSGAGYEPVSLEFLSGNGAEYRIRMRWFRPLPSADVVSFELNPADYPEAVVTDLR